MGEEVSDNTPALFLRIWMLLKIYPCFNLIKSNELILETQFVWNNNWLNLQCYKHKQNYTIAATELKFNVALDTK